MLKRQLYFVYITTLFLSIFILGSFLLYNNYSMLYEHHQNMLISDNLRIRSIVFEATTSITNVCDILSEDKEMNQLIRGEYKSYEEASEFLEEMHLLTDLYSRYTEISSVNLYVDNENLHSYKHIVVIDDNNREWFESNINKPGYYWSTLNATNNFGVKYQELQLLHYINVPGSDYNAILEITISNNYLKNRIDNNDLDVDITVNHDPIFFSTWGNANRVIDFKSYNEEEFFRFSGIDTYMNKENLLEVSTIQPIKANDSIYIFSTDGKAQDKIKRIQLIAILIVGMSLIIPTIIIMRYTRQLTNRIDTLRSEMHRVTSGDYDIIEHFKGNDELVDLFNDLQTMIHSIEERDQAIFDGKLMEQKLMRHQKEIELELLSSKINPHFLYNTLETIRMKAFNSDNLEVAHAVKLLGKYMRYNLESTGELTTLKSELDYIDIYLSIQKIRFKSRIDYFIEVDERVKLEEIKVLPLLIQPLVENALLHGHEETIEDGKIFIKCLDKGDYVQIEIEDNGSGMSEKTLEKIKRNINQTTKANNSSIGLYNTQQRLVLFYGEKSRLTIVSTINKGTMITFYIPKILPERNYDA